MNELNLLKEFEGDPLEKDVIAPLVQSLTLMNKFSVLPIYFMQFLISKSTYMPHVVLTAYDDRDMVLSASNAIGHMNSVIFGDTKCMKTITPTAIVYPQSISLRDVIYNTSEDYWYSSSFVISGKELKNILQKKLVEITNLRINTDSQKKIARVSIGWKTSESDPVDLNTLLAPISDSVYAIRLPLINICKKINSFNDIISEIVKSVPTSFKSSDPDDATIINNLANDVKENQMIDIPKTEAKVFKDFIKQKPENMLIWSHRDDEEIGVRSVAIDMNFKNNKSNVILMYRYLDNLLDSLSVNEG